MSNTAHRDSDIQEPHLDSSTTYRLLNTVLQERVEAEQGYRRSMGANPLHSITWRGVADKVHKAEDKYRQQLYLKGTIKNHREKIDRDGDSTFFFIPLFEFMDTSHYLLDSQQTLQFWNLTFSSCRGKI